MKIVCLLLLSLICISCNNQIKQHAISLNNDLELVPILSPSFDSLLLEVQTLPSRYRIKIFLEICNRDEVEVGKIKKQEELLVAALPFAKKEDKKKVLQRLIALYRLLDKQGISCAISKGIKCCEELGQNYSLTQEEQWEMKKAKAFFLNIRGEQEQSLLIWQDLLEEHRSADKIKYIIEDLNTIASCFVKVGDIEKGLSIFKDAYHLALNKKLSEAQSICLRSIIKHSCNIGRYDEVVILCNKIGVDSIATSFPAIYSMLSTCYLQLQKTDSARYYLSKARKVSKRENGIVYNCRMAETFIPESQKDSVAYYLGEAMRHYEIQNDLYKTKLPLYFMPVYAEYATLLQKEGEMGQAGEVFRLIEPLMSSNITDMPWVKKQIDALASYVSYLQFTEQYKKATKLLVFRDSIQQRYYQEKESIASKNFADRFKIKDLETVNKLKQQEIDFTVRTSAISWVVCILLIFVIAIFVVIVCRMHKKIKLRDNKIIELSSPKPIISSRRDSLSPEEQLYNSAKKLVESKKLYLNSELTLDELAKEIGTNRASLSAAINHCSKYNFNQWINKYRVNHIVEHISEVKNFQTFYKSAGFNAYNTFNTCFKEHMKCTPKQFQKKYKSEVDSAG